MEKLTHLCVFLCLGGSSENDIASFSVFSESKRVAICWGLRTYRGLLQSTYPGFAEETGWKFVGLV